MIYEGDFNLLYRCKLPKNFDHDLFKKKVKKILKERKISYYDLVDGTGYKYTSIAQYFYNGTSRFIATALASYLHISLMEGVKKNEKEGKK